MPGTIELRDLHVWYDSNEVLRGISLQIPIGTVVALVGPSGCGKTTLLRTINRLSPATCKVAGTILLDGTDTRRIDPIVLRRRIGMVFQKPNPFPMSIRENVLYGVKAQGGKRSTFTGIVEDSLRTAGLWNEVSGRLRDSALALSVGQQQRLCIARALAVSPEVLLMDEPSASLDPAATALLESSITAMKGEYTVVMVTHDHEQARRVADYVVEMREGWVVDFVTNDGAASPNIRLQAHGQPATAS